MSNYIHNVEDVQIGSRVSEPPSWLHSTRRNGTVVDMQGKGPNGKLIVEYDDGSMSSPSYPAKFELEDNQSEGDTYRMPPINPPISHERLQREEDRDHWLDTGQIRRRPQRRSSVRASRKTVADVCRQYNLNERDARHVAAIVHRHTSIDRY